MQERIKELADFIKKYGEDYLQDGTKTRIVSSIENGNMKMTLDILDVLNKEWIDRTKELGKFFIFTDYKNPSIFDEQPVKPHFKANYIDSANLRLKKIPVLRDVKVKTNQLYSNRLTEWEI